MRVLVLLFIRSTCSVEDRQQGDAKSLAGAIKDSCTEEYEYLRFELVGGSLPFNAQLDIGSLLEGI